MRVNAFAIRSHRLNMVALRVSNIRPMRNELPRARARGRFCQRLAPRACHGSRTVNVDPRSGCAFDRDAAAHGVDHLAHDPEAQPQAAVVAFGDARARSARRSGQLAPRTCRCRDRGRRSRLPRRRPGRSAPTSTEIGRPAPYLTALDSKFVRICSRRSRSQFPRPASGLHVDGAVSGAKVGETGPPRRAPARPARSARAAAPSCRP